jgi:ABC-type transport system involved in multi-copper enzyme maturation permease subunit
MDNSNSFRRFFGAFLTILGTIVILYTLVLYLNHGTGTTGMQIRNLGDAVVPFLVGILFFGAGVGLVQRS